MKKNSKKNRQIFVKEVIDFLVKKGATGIEEKNTFLKLNDFSFIIEPESVHLEVYTVFCKNTKTLSKHNFHVFDIHDNINEVVYDFIEHFNDLGV